MTSRAGRSRRSPNQDVRRAKVGGGKSNFSTGLMDVSSLQQAPGALL